MLGADCVPRRPTILIILDGYGENPSKLNNAVAEANTPNFDLYFSQYQHTLLQASGKAAGLPEGQMGNSEVGHMTLGSGSIVRQDLVQICDSIADQSFFENEVLVASVKRAAETNRPLHLLGLASNGGVHSHSAHLVALITLCKRHKVIPNLHMITDGRDTPPKVALEQLKSIQQATDDAGGLISTICGRFYAMDRDNRWDRTSAAWQVMVNGIGEKAKDVETAISDSYKNNIDDEFILPTFLDGGQLIEAGDEVLCFNFRRDRPRQIVTALFRDDFDGFDRGDYEPVNVTCFTEYDQWYKLPYAFEQEKPEITLAQILSDNDLQQFHCAETEKFAHVTFFFNGGRGDQYPGEERIIVPSPDVKTYDLQPEMSAAKVADNVIDAINSRDFGFIVVNFANGDMVGHTAIRDAVIKAVETLDREVGRVLDAAVAQKFSVILTSDHGNCDEMIDPVTGAPQTQHTVYPVPCLIIDKIPWKLTVGGGLSNIAPTILQLMGLTIPQEMHGESMLLNPIQA